MHASKLYAIAVLCMLPLYACHRSPEIPDISPNAPENVHIDKTKKSDMEASPDAEIPSTTDDTGPKADPVAPVKTSDDAAPAAEQIKPIPNSELTIGSDEVIFPEIAIQVHLDQDSHKRLLENRETIIIQGYLEVYPNDPLPKQYQNEMDSDGSLTIAQARVETDPDNTAVILKDMKCNRKLYDALPKNDRDHIELLVNVFSGRKSSDLNLLDCGIVSGTIHEVKGKEHDISCKLIDPIQ